MNCSAVRVLLAVLVLAGITVTTRYAVMLHSWPDKAPSSEANCDNYGGIAERLYSHGEYGEYSESRGGYRYRARRAPGLPCALWGLYASGGGVSRWNGLLLNLACEVLTVLLLFWHATRASRRLAVGFLVGLVYAIYLPVILLAPYLGTEPLYTLLLLTGCLVLMPTLRLDVLAARTAWRGAATGILWGAASLTRPILFYFPFIFLAAAAAISLFRRRMVLASAATVLLTCFLVVHVPWALRNQAVLNQPVFTTTWGGNHMFQKNFVLGGFGTDNYLRAYPRATAEYRRARAILESGAGRELSEMSELERDRVFMNAVKETIRQHPDRFVLSSAVGVSNLWFGVDFHALPDLWTALRGLFSLMMLTFGGWGLFTGWRRGNWDVLLPACLVVYFTVLHAISVPESRYLLPMTPLLLVLAVEPISILWQSVLKRLGSVQPAMNGTVARLSRRVRVIPFRLRDANL